MVRGAAFLFCLIVVPLSLAASVATAGMASPLPTDPERVLRLNDTPRQRLQAISFFVLGLLGCALAVRFLWNFLQRDFPRLPRLTLGKALAGVVLWGLALVIVLAMIAGARELMTPGAWQKQGWTYKLTNGEIPAPAPAARRQHIEQLRTALLQFAATHGGRYPLRDETSAIPDEFWEVPDAGGLRYRYVPGLSGGDEMALLACEPDLGAGGRLALMTNGSIVSLREERP
jgi:hypothetical protein